MTRKIPLLGERRREKRVVGGRENQYRSTIAKVEKTWVSTYPLPLPSQRTPPPPKYIQLIQTTNTVLFFGNKPGLAISSVMQFNALLAPLQITKCSSVTCIGGLELFYLLNTFCLKNAELSAFFYYYRVNVSLETY